MSVSQLPQEVSKQETRMIAALATLSSNPGMSLRRVAHLHKVPRTTLTRRMRGSKPRFERLKEKTNARARANARMLSDDEERRMVRYIELLEEMGLDLRLRMLHLIGNKIVSTREDETQRGLRVGETWIRSFLGRWGLAKKFGREEVEGWDGQWAGIAEEELEEQVWRSGGGKEKGVSHNQDFAATPPRPVGSPGENRMLPKYQISREVAPAPVMSHCPDPEHKRQLSDLTALLYSSNDLAEVRRLALKIADIAGGAIVHVAVVQGMVEQFNAVLAELQGAEDEDETDGEYEAEDPGRTEGEGEVEDREERGEDDGERAQAM